MKGVEGKSAGDVFEEAIVDGFGGGEFVWVGEVVVSCGVGEGFSPPGTVVGAGDGRCGIAIGDGFRKT